MSHDDNHDSHDSDTISIAHFFEEYGPVLLFGSFFLMTCFLPQLFLEGKDKTWMYVAFPLVLVIIFSLLVLPTLFGKKSS